MERLNRAIWNFVYVLLIAFVGYAVAMWQITLHKEDDVPSEDISKFCPVCPECLDRKDALNAVYTAQQVLDNKARVSTPQGVRSAYRDASTVLGRAIQMIEQGP